MTRRAVCGGRVLLLGWRNAFVRAAHEATGVRPVVVYGPGDRNWYEPDLSLAKAALFVEDPSDIEQIVLALARARVLEDWAGVCPTSEEHVVAAAVLARILDAPGPPLDDAVVCRDKLLQKERIAAAGLPVAENVLIPDLELHRWGSDGDVEEAPVRLPFPAILKPVAGAGTVNTRHVPRQDALATAAEELLRNSHARVYLCERRVEMDEEWEVDAVVAGGEVRFLAVGVYGQPSIDVREGYVLRQVTLDPVRDAREYDLALRLVAGAVRALGLERGVLHLEAYHRATSPDLVFGECALRPAGGMITEVVREKFGVDLVTAHIAACCHIDVDPEITLDDSYVGSTMLPSFPGLLVSRPDAREVAALPGVRRAVVQAPPGLRMASSTEGYSIRIGMAVMADESRARLDARLVDLADWYRSKTVASEAPADYEQPPVWVLRRDADAGPQPPHPPSSPLLR